ncbi:hypothetical protein AX16_007921 [Volvariella volvacea WC 439]|nr:hypothetical protein AX16_007921 [Volvariella volvacea WC 439]
MHLCRCEFAMDVDENQGVLAPTSLEELRLDTAMTNKQSLERMITFFVYPFSSVKISDLKHLSLRLRHGNENLDVMHLFSHCRHSLESLDLEAGEHISIYLHISTRPHLSLFEADSLTNFSLEGMTKLRNIHLSIVSPVWTPPLFPDEDHENLPIPSLVAILLTIPVTCVLDVIFGIFINISSQVAYRGQELRPLDEALTSLVHTGVVQRIEVLCSKGVVDPALVRPCLARCDGTGRLRISVAPETTRIFSSF